MDGDALRPRGLAARIGHAWLHPRESARAEAETADEGRLLFYAVLASALTALGEIGADYAQGPGAGFSEAAVQNGVTALLFRPLMLYAVAGLICWLCRLAGGTGSWRAGRVALFWSDLAAAGPGALATVAGVSVGGVAGSALADAGGVLWALLLAPMIAELHGFRGVAWVYAALFGAGAALIAVAALVAGGGAA